MIRTLSLATGLALSLSVAALAQVPGPAPSPKGGTEAPATTSPGAVPSNTPKALSAGDRRFVEKAASGGLAEIQESQLAQDKAKDEAVKTFAEKMVQDHASADDKLKSIVDQAGVQAPSNPDAADQKQLAALRKLHGKAFDQRYVKDAIADHKATVALFEKEAQSGSDPQLKQFASDTLPTIKQHLSDAEGLTRRNLQ